MHKDHSKVTVHLFLQSLNSKSIIKEETIKRKFFYPKNSFLLKILVPTLTHGEERQKAAQYQQARFQPHYKINVNSVFANMLIGEVTRKLQSTSCELDHNCATQWKSVFTVEASKQLLQVLQPLVGFLWEKCRSKILAFKAKILQ